jgi:predicted nucleic acid-binding protein
MSAVVDTSVLIDYLRGSADAKRVLEEHRAEGPLHASEITRLEVLAGMRPSEADATRSLLSAFEWHSVDEDVAERAGALERKWLASHHTIDSADLAVGATAEALGVSLLTRNVRHFPMFPGLRPPY